MRYLLCPNLSFTDLASLPLKRRLIEYLRPLYGHIIKTTGLIRTLPLKTKGASNISGQGKMLELPKKAIIS
jgi:hypothetical protein